MKKGCTQGLAPSKHPISVPLRRKTKRDWRGQAWQRDQLEAFSSKAQRIHEDLDQGGDDENSDSGYIFKIQPTGLLMYWM